MPENTDRAARRVVVWRVTSACDLDCGFCGFARSAGRRRTHADPEQVLAIGAALGGDAAATGRETLVSWLGGEPLLWPGFVAVSRRFHDDFGLRLSMTTNAGRLGAPGLAEFVSAYFDEVTFSLDSDDLGQHDTMRGGPGNGQAIRAGILSMNRLRGKRSGLTLRINTILMRDTIDRFAALCELAASWGVDEISFNPLGGRDRPAFFPAHQLDAGDFERFRIGLPELRRRMAARGLAIAGDDRYLDRIASAIAGASRPVADCRPGERFLFIDIDGRIGPCHFTLDHHSLRAGPDFSRDDAAALPARLARARAAQPHPACADCQQTNLWGKFERVPQGERE
ncbi:MAG: radical SAM protein [Thermoflexales bacterium]